MKRNRAHKARLLLLKKRTYYPIAYCLHEDKPVAVSMIKCKAGTKVHWNHWSSNNAKFIFGYQFDLVGKKIGETIYCPLCGHPLDFRLWMSDVTPTIS